MTRDIPSQKDQYDAVIFFISLLIVSKMWYGNTASFCAVDAAGRGPAVVIADSSVWTRYDRRWIYWHSHTTIAMTPKLSPITLIRRNSVTKWRFNIYLHTATHHVFLFMFSYSYHIFMSSYSYHHVHHIFGIIHNRSVKIIACWRLVFLTSSSRTGPIR